MLSAVEVYLRDLVHAIVQDELGKSQVDSPEPVAASTSSIAEMERLRQTPWLQAPQVRVLRRPLAPVPPQEPPTKFLPLRPQNRLLAPTVLPPWGARARPRPYREIGLPGFPPTARPIGARPAALDDYLAGHYADPALHPQVVAAHPPSATAHRGLRVSCGETRGGRNPGREGCQRPNSQRPSNTAVTRGIGDDTTPESPDRCRLLSPD